RRAPPRRTRRQRDARDGFTRHRSWHTGRTRRRVGQMAARAVRARDKDTLALFLGWFSIGLGTAQVTAPRAMCKLVGARGEGTAPTLMRLIGMREIAQGVGILTRPGPTVR